MSERRATAHWQADLALAQLTARNGPVPAALPPLRVEDVQEHLREAGVTVHHVSRMPTPRDGRQVVVVFLDDDPEQIELGRDAARRMTGVIDVVCSGYNRAVMYVVAGPIHPVPPTPTDTPATGTSVLGRR